MKTKTIKIISIFIIFLISFITHNLYEWIPSFFTSIICPVNESIFEHLKMIFTSYMFWMIIELILKYKYKDLNNVISSNTFTAIFNIIVFLIIYLPIYYLLFENMFINLSVYFISLVISYFINYMIALKNNDKLLNIISIIIIIVSYIIFATLTYNPLKKDIFLDKQENIYGIK